MLIPCVMGIPSEYAPRLGCIVQILNDAHRDVLVLVVHGPIAEDACGRAFQTWDLSICWKKMAFQLSGIGRIRRLSRLYHEKSINISHLKVKDDSRAGKSRGGIKTEVATEP